MCIYNALRDRPYDYQTNSIKISSTNYTISTGTTYSSQIISSLIKIVSVSMYLYARIVICLDKEQRLLFDRL